MNKLTERASPDRPRRTLELLAEHPEGMTTSQISDAMGEGRGTTPLSWYGGILRAAMGRGWVTRDAKRLPGGWQQGSSYVWHITPAGAERIAEYYEVRDGVRRQANLQLARKQEQRERVAAELRSAQERVAGMTPQEKYDLVVHLRGLPCTLQEIADVFGVSRQWISLVLKQGTWEFRFHANVLDPRECAHCKLDLTWQRNAWRDASGATHCTAMTNPIPGHVVIRKDAE